MQSHDYLRPRASRGLACQAPAALGVLTRRADIQGAAMDKFKAYRIFEDDGKVTAAFVQMRLDELDAGRSRDPGRVLERQLQGRAGGTGAGKIIRRFPCIGGIDAAAPWSSSSDRALQSGRRGDLHELRHRRRARRRLCASTRACRPTGSCRCRRAEPVRRDGAGHRRLHGGLAVELLEHERPQARQRASARHRRDRRRRHARDRHARRARLSRRRAHRQGQRDGLT